jgi:predicted peptidase
MRIPGTQQEETWQASYPNVISSHYLPYLPRDYEALPQKRWPLILFLHGAGERGNHVDLVKTQGLPKKLQALHGSQDFPFIVVSPQCLPNNRWYPHVLNSLLDEVLRIYPIYEERIYLTGLSMGGYGTWALAIAAPQRFAAIAPICGGGDPEHVCAIAHLPVWAFHGAKDTIVPLQSSIDMVEALKKCGGNVRLTIYPQAEHDSWTETYDNPQLYDWFLENKRV